MNRLAVTVSLLASMVLTSLPAVLNSSRVLAAVEPDVEWNKTFDGPGYYYGGRSVQQTSDGGYIIAGITDPALDPSLVESYDIWLLKTDASGNKLWDKTFGSPDIDDWDYGYSVQQTTDGGFIIVGYTESYGAGDRDVWLIKTDASGNRIWDRTFGGSGYNDEGQSIQQTSDGGYIVTGRTHSYGAGYSDVWLIKTDASGNPEWVDPITGQIGKTFGGSENDGGRSVQQTSDGGYIIAGYTESYGAGYSDIWLLKTDASGNMLWDKTFGGSDNDGGRSVRQTSDGGYIIAGDVTGDATDAVLIKTNASGEELWVQTFGSPNIEDYDYGYSVQQTIDGGYIMAGHINSYGAGFEDAYLIKTDASGNKLWDKTFDGVGYFVQQTMDGGYIVTGDAEGGLWLIKLETDIVPTITFDSHGGSPIPPITQEYGTTVTPPADPTREGYTFNDWSPSVPSTMPAENITCVAQWTVNQYTITFDSDDGSPVPPITQEYGTPLTPPPDPTREGYNFINWSPSVPSTMPAENITCVAQWTTNQVYSLTMAISGEGNTYPSAGPHTYNEGTVVEITAIPDSGWQFVSWTGNVADHDSASTTVTMDGNKTVTASFTEIAVVTYELTMAVSGNGTASPGTGSQTYNKGKVVKITATPDSGWEFASWSGDVNDPDSANTTVTMDSDKTVTANFTEIAVVTYELTMAVSGNGTTSPGTGSQTYNKGKIVKITAAPDSGWEFASWSGDVNDPNSANTTVTMDSDKTVTANFTEIESKVLARRTIFPESPATVYSEDGQIMIQFPAGSFDHDAILTIKRDSRDLIPSCPSGYRAGATYFSVEMTEDLVPGKTVTITIKYTSDDLEASGGDTDKLTLSRYDEGSGEWIILPTKLDTQAMTLTTSTDRFSTWLVMAGEGLAGEASDEGGTALWIWLVSLFTGLAVVIAIAGAIIEKRRKSSVLYKESSH